MGRSPGKWIKTILFGKKPSKSSFLKRSATDKEATIACKAVSGDLAANPSVISDVVLHTTNRIEEKSEKDVGAHFPHGALVSLPGKRGAPTEGTFGLDPLDSAEVIRLEQAAMKAQAAFRGYLARRAFRALKGIIKLQALIRGHLVRRQAVTTLRCLQGIVKLQALVRGRRVRLSVCGLEVQKKCSLDVLQRELFGLHTTARPDKLLSYAFICKLLASSSTVMPLNLCYNPHESNSAWNWLERWSLFQFWGPLPQPKGIPNSKFHGQQDSIQAGEIEPIRVKRGVRKVPTEKVYNSLHPTLESEKSRRNLRKARVHQAESLQEHPQSELHRVKRSLRKVSLAPDRSEAVTERPKLNMRKLLSSEASDVPQKSVDNFSEKVNDSIVVVSKDAEFREVEILPKPLQVDEIVNRLHHDDPTGELLPLETVEKIDNTPMVNEERIVMEDQTSKENQSRRKSFPVKQQNSENVSQNTLSLPSYMAATESAKAKLKAQGSPKFEQDGIENGFTRRHSLPTSDTSKLIMSPQVQGLIQANGKGGRKIDRPPLSSKDGRDKMARAGWKR
ncbi:hypothetical protein F2P56_021285 [Juglans regia]|uniref:Protein IQ-DOMAIN 31-like isoform X1 n=2 Tax=Juglans regia TaxID=51240 RepID=A0A2I4FWC8_JUGRE|nr:protein IQ-DOMAIN 31-like isoform X1 [Juglans regia]XP_018835959.1 protein IQ-DOMAIN 31-like isoform X1 [Juglans regia]XP_018835960.1 protein IQ-DOMAIN 31-like isoform X1 [Juglans regia]XP_018835961.1 protein IQ-DOMAIN 31-like isoform X1 [Juglans regia]KAF5457159.1 hypothetical protein F2P56_021285 [Juglans regia]